MTEHNSGTPASFNLKAHCYEEHARVQSDAADWLANWLPEGRKNLRCLEFGAGTGLLTQHLLQTFDHVEASDLWHEMIEICGNKFPQIKHSRRDAWEPQKDTAAWDSIVSSSLLQWAPNPVACLMNWRDMLKQDGRILVGFFIHPSLPEMLKTLSGKSPLQWRTEKEWSSFFKEAGLCIVRMDRDTRRYQYENALKFWKSLHGTGATVSRGMHPSEMMRLLKNYESQFGDESGVFATWTFCRAELRRA
ncbi:MAG: methyltransferase domain-containing protein [Opitutales bacterium]